MCFYLGMTYQPINEKALRLQLLPIKTSSTQFQNVDKLVAVALNDV